MCLNFLVKMGNVVSLHNGYSSGAFSLQRGAHGLPWHFDE